MRDSAIETVHPIRVIFKAVDAFQSDREWRDHKPPQVMRSILRAQALLEVVPQLKRAESRDDIATKATNACKALAAGGESFTDAGDSLDRLRAISHAAIVALRDSGYSINQIQLATKVSEDAVYRYLATPTPIDRDFKLFVEAFARFYA